MIFRVNSPWRKRLFHLILVVVLLTVGSLSVLFALSVFLEERREVYADISYYYDHMGDEKIIALTFDDGPHPEQTRDIMDVLEKHGVPATFFFMGSSALEHPDVVKEAYDEGFEIGNHTFTHSWEVHKSRNRLEFELNLTNKILKSITGEDTTLYRPPFLLDIGSDPTNVLGQSPEALEWAAQRGYYVIGADVDSKDYLAKSVDEVAATFYADLPTGHIALFHDGLEHTHTPEALDVIIPELKARGYRFVYASETLGVRPKPSMLSGALAVVNASTFEFPSAEKTSLQDRVFSASIRSSSEFGSLFVLFMYAVLWLGTLRFIGTLSLYALAKINKPEYSGTFAPGVSVVVPVYNEQENVGATLDSMIKNGYPNMEIIVVDDGSKDNSAEVVRSFASAYPDIVRLVQVENGGKARALNIGISRAAHDIVITTDGDSVLSRDAIRMLARHFDDPSVGAVAGKVQATTSNHFLNRFQYLEYVISQNIDKEAFSFIGAIGVVPGPIGAWRKSAILKAGGYSHDTLVEDQDLTLAILALGMKVLYEPGAISYTETPYTVRDFIKQRFRWIYGTMQCAWKYKSYVFSFKAWILGWILVPNTSIYTILLSLISPIMDAMLIYTFIFGLWEHALAVYIVFTFIDLAYSGLALRTDRERKGLFMLLPLQRLFYRFVITYVVFKSVARAIEGTEVLWNKVAKKGEAGRHHIEFLQKDRAIPVLAR